MRFRLTALVLTLPIFIVPACTKGNPSMSPKRKVATYGIRIADGVKAAQDAARNLYAQGIIPKAQYDKVLTGFIRVGDAGVKLADLLRAYDAATDPAQQNSLAVQIDIALVALGTALPEVFAPIADDAVRAKVSGIVGEVQKLVITIARLTAPRGAYLRQHDHDLRLRDDIIAFGRVFAY